MYSTPHAKCLTLTQTYPTKTPVGPTLCTQANRIERSQTRNTRTRHLSRSAPQIPPQPRYRGRIDDLVEQRCAPDEKRETRHLQPFEGFPAEAERDEPDEECAAGVDCAARCGGDLPGYGEAEEVETAVRRKEC
jgi:hypothetical protein